MAKYAEGSEVPIGRSRDELERLLARYHADEGFIYGREGNLEVVGFAAHGRRVRFTVPMPSQDAREFTHTPSGQRRSASSVASAYEAERRRRWRVFILVVKSKLESVASGVETFEEAFLAQILLPSGETVIEATKDGIAEAYRSGATPQLLAGLRPRELPGASQGALEAGGPGA